MTKCKKDKDKETCSQELEIQSQFILQTPHLLIHVVDVVLGFEVMELGVAFVVVVVVVVVVAVVVVVVVAVAVVVVVVVAVVAAAVVVVEFVQQFVVL